MYQKITNHDEEGSFCIANGTDGEC